VTNVVGDTSVIVAAISSWHPSHLQAAERMKGIASAISHILAEAYSSVTRMPAFQRRSHVEVIQYFFEQFTSEVSIPPYLPSLNELVERGITGGAIYDGLIAMAARNAGLKLLTLDQRAARTYEAVGDEYELLN
jgi:predicted nucleic acid-binding protein